jgi:hypothetical protein
MMYTSIREDAQADIWQAWLWAVAHRTRITSHRRERVLAHADARPAAFLRDPRGADSTQRLWKFPLDGGDLAVAGAPRAATGGLPRLGRRPHGIGAFVLGSPNALVLVDARTERADTLARDIGRALVRVPGRDAFTFQQLGGDTTWVSEVDVRTQQVRRVAPLPPRAEYHLWTPPASS